MGAAVKIVLVPDSVAADPRSARRANRGKRVDRALEGVDGVLSSVHYDLEGSLVEASGTTLLMDPVFFDPFEEGAVVSCPRRTVCLERLPSIDIVVVSHRHPDHFDLRSLDRLPRSCDVICPADPLIVYGLRGLGFEHIHPVYPMGEIVGEGFELYA